MVAVLVLRQYDHRPPDQHPHGTETSFKKSFLPLWQIPMFPCERGAGGALAGNSTLCVDLADQMDKNAGIGVRKPYRRNRPPISGCLLLPEHASAGSTCVSVVVKSCIIYVTFAGFNAAHQWVIGVL